MAINYTTPGAFAEHYRTGKFTDLGLVAKSGTQFNVHKLVVCSHSPVLDAQTADGATILDTGDDATTLGQMIEWMYGIDHEQLLIDGKSVGEVLALGSSEVYGEILTLSDLAGIAEKYQLPKLKYQATELVGQLVENTTSLPCLLEAILHSAPENAKGTVQKILAARALDLTQGQDDVILADQGENTLTHREKHRPIPLSSHADPTENKEREPSVNIDRSALRSATGSLKHARQEDTDSDTPLKQQSSKRQKQNGRSTANIAAPKAGAKVKQATPATARQSQAFGQDTVSRQTQVQPGSNTQGPRLTNEAYNFSKDHQAWMTDMQQGIEKLENEIDNTTKTRPTRRNEPFRISTALPENDPPRGPHCHCKAASTDPTLLACAECGNKYHPRCVGKGRYSKGTYCGNPQHYMLKDVELFREKPFKCGDCEEGFFGGR